MNANRPILTVNNTGITYTSMNQYIKMRNVFQPKLTYEVAACATTTMTNPCNVNDCLGTKTNITPFDNTNLVQPARQIYSEWQQSMFPGHQ
jgi:hypothetical protein